MLILWDLRADASQQEVRTKLREYQSRIAQLESEHQQGRQKLEKEVR